MALSDSQRKANAKYIKENYQRLPVSYPKDFCNLIREAAEAQGETLAGYVRKAVEQRMQRDLHPNTLDGEEPPFVQQYLGSIKK